MSSSACALCFSLHMSRSFALAPDRRGQILQELEPAGGLGSRETLRVIHAQHLSMQGTFRGVWWATSQDAGSTLKSVEKLRMEGRVKKHMEFGKFFAE
mmetsp:Transcript_39769/g.92317  ORF Transcript_39769/g.92317 Transcript_39769/m.92317 type:complete len:98 (+) Transcript_39769:296-589(+)